MPRHKRINLPGGIHHVIVRGHNRQEIFLGERDRHDFLGRLEQALLQTGCQCLAWALLHNHFHLLIRAGSKPLGDLMRKILSGYAVSFNRRHQRGGYLFQNRYKSILCQEESYLLELVRYIHLNPVRSATVKSIEELDRYTWSGHSVLVGHRRRSWQERTAVLSRFGANNQEAIRRYRQFIIDGFQLGKRADLTSGGYIRGRSGWEGANLSHGDEEHMPGNARILGDKQFVTKALQAVEEELSKKTQLAQKGWDLERLVTEVCTMLAVPPIDLQKKGRANNLSLAKGTICFLGYSQLGISGTALADYFNISRASVSKAIHRGEQFVTNNQIKLLS
jgi:REP element-mobilizing transposase RayT